jgi:hypothetical protein
MGQEIRYCWKCNIRLLGSDFEKGKAVQAGNHSSCLECAPGLPEAPVPLKAPPPTPRPRGGSSVRIPTIKDDPPSKLGWILALCGGGAVVVVALALASGGSPKPPPLPPPPKVVEKKLVEVSPKEASAGEAVAKAKAAGTVEAWQEAVFASEGTSKLEEARRELEAAKRKRQEGLARDVATLEEQSRAPLLRDAYGAAIGILEDAKGRRNEAEWRLRIENRIAEIRKEAEAKLEPLLGQAAELKGRGAEAELRTLEERIGRWELPEAVEALRAALAKVPHPGVCQPDASGRAVFEAEKFTLNRPAGEHAWTEVTEPAGFAGASAMRALPNGARQLNSGYSKGPRLEYRVNFPRAGRYYVWIRAQAGGSGDDSLHAGLDGKESKSLEYISLSRHKAWHWVNQVANGAPATFEIDQPGARTFCLYMREDGLAVDRVVLTPDPAWKPEGQGPPESPR